MTYPRNPQYLLTIKHLQNGTNISRQSRTKKNRALQSITRRNQNVIK